jgi:hypothetical protein
MKKRSAKSKRTGKKNRGNAQEPLKNLGELPATSDNPPSGKSPDDIKMSEIILTLADPLLQKYKENFGRAHGILTLAVIAWNMSMLPEPDEEQLVANIASSLPPEFSAVDVAMILNTVYLLMQRKRELFPDIRRVIVNHEVRKTETGFDLTVGSAPVPTTPSDSLIDTVPDQ